LNGLLCIAPSAVPEPPPIFNGLYTLYLFERTLVPKHFGIPLIDFKLLSSVVTAGRPAIARWEASRPGVAVMLPLLLLTVLVGPGCSDPISQNLKNEAFTLGARWSTASDSLDAMERKLLIAQTVSRQNKGELGGAVSSVKDSADKAYVQRKYDAYLQQIEEFQQLRDSVEALQKRYVRAHKAYNTYMDKVEKNKMSTSEAQALLYEHRQRRREIMLAIRKLYPKVNKAINEHNKLVRELSDATDAYNLTKIGDS
jgi:hypothetical protein